MNNKKELKKKKKIQQKENDAQIHTRFSKYWENIV